MISSCVVDLDESRARMNFIDVNSISYTVDRKYNVTIAMTHEKEREFFEWIYETNEPKEVQGIDSFFFSFYCEDPEHRHMDESFDVTSNGERLEFYSRDIYRQYDFSGSITIRISYENSNDHIKECISKDDYSFSCFGESWMPYNQQMFNDTYLINTDKPPMYLVHSTSPFENIAKLKKHASYSF